MPAQKRSWDPPPGVKSETYMGPLCPIHDHSIGSKDGLVPRYSDSHACVRCVSSLTEGRLLLNVHAIHRLYRRHFLTFWSFVDMPGPDECWTWHGSCKKNDPSRPYYGMKRHWSQGRTYSPPRVATWLSWGDIGSLPISHICGNHTCCNPTHIKIGGVCHFWHAARLSPADINFSIHKLISETQGFIEFAKDNAPAQFRELNAINDLWIQARLAQSSEVGQLSSSAVVINPADDDPEEFL